VKPFGKGGTELKTSLEENKKIVQEFCGFLPRIKDFKSPSKYIGSRSN